MKDIFADIAISLPVEGPFTYRVPSTLADMDLFGRRVLVPFGKRTVTGYVVGMRTEALVNGVKDIIDALDAAPIFDRKRLEFYRWMASYYFSTLGEVLSLIHPSEANVRSLKVISLTPEGEVARSGMEGLSREILDAAGKKVKLSALVKRLRGAPVCSAVQRLKDKGLILEETLFEGVGRRKLETVASPEPDRKAVPDSLRRSPVQMKVYEYLLENGETSISVLSGAIEGASGAVKRLYEKGLLRISSRQVLRDPMTGLEPRSSDHEPNHEQKGAIDAIASAVRKGGFSPFLLYGVTGSGKTLVYLKVLDEAVRAGKKAVFLVPEISLTPQAAAYLSGRFPGRVAVMHSGLSAGERIDQWERILKGDADIVVGARSALFCPLPDLSLIIVDEEHETSYKQEDGVRYNGRDAALMLGKYLDITVVLGSATPSIETFYNAKTGKLSPLYLRERVQERALPKVELLDMKGVKEPVISGRLSALLQDTVKSGHQALLFLNRRGFSNSIICRGCGQSFKCLNCSVSLTLHKSPPSLTCHYCDLSMPVPKECPVCRGVNLVSPGTGTEKVEEEVKRLIPGVRAARMDRDTTRRKGSAKAIMDSVEDKSVDVLIGTQMVSKGHHFPGIALVGIISGDTSLNIPDFRSAERTFQLLTQAAGRSGRGDVPGEVIIQTLNPEHYVFGSAIGHDYAGFYDEEIRMREALLYPPFSRLCCLRVDGVREEAVIKAASFLKASAGEILKKRKDSVITLLGPAPALLSRLKGRHRWQLLARGRELKPLHALVKSLQASFRAEKISGVALTIDMDPITIV